MKRCNPPIAFQRKASKIHALTSERFFVMPGHPACCNRVTETGTCNGGLTPFTMDWGDNSQTDPFAGTTTLNHTYTSTGALLATLTAQDANGGTFTVSQQVTVITPVACKLAMNPSQGAVP